MNIKLILFMLFLAVHSSSYAQEEVTAEEKAAIKKFLEMTGSLDIGLMFSKVMVEQMTDLLQQSNPEIPPRAFTILEEEVEVQYLTNNSISTFSILSTLGSSTSWTATLAG